MLLRKYTVKGTLFFHLTCASALPGKIKNDKIASFHSNAVLFNCRLQSVAGVIYSVSLFATHAHAAIWLSQSHSQWS